MKISSKEDLKSIAGFFAVVASVAAAYSCAYKSAEKACPEIIGHYVQQNSTGRAMLPRF